MVVYSFKDVNFYNENQSLNTSLTKIQGIGLMKSRYICDLVGISPTYKIGFLSGYLFFIVTYVIKNFYCTDIFLKRLKENRLKIFLSLKTYKSVKYAAGLPIRGQHTHTNAKTAKKSKRRSKK